MGAAHVFLNFKIYAGGKEPQLTLGFGFHKISS
jgi:hypothetical protein